MFTCEIILCAFLLSLLIYTARVKQLSICGHYHRGGGEGGLVGTGSFATAVAILQAGKQVRRAKNGNVSLWSIPGRARLALYEHDVTSPQHNPQSQAQVQGHPGIKTENFSPLWDK